MQLTQRVRSSMPTTLYLARAYSFIEQSQKDARIQLSRSPSPPLLRMVDFMPMGGRGGGESACAARVLCVSGL